jgi:hypothetical protein
MTDQLLTYKFYTLQDRVPTTAAFVDVELAPLMVLGMAMLVAFLGPIVLSYRRRVRNGVVSRHRNAGLTALRKSDATSERISPLHTIGRPN